MGDFEALDEQARDMLEQKLIKDYNEKINELNFLKEMLTQCEEHLKLFIQKREDPFYNDESHFGDVFMYIVNENLIKNVEEMQIGFSNKYRQAFNDADKIRTQLGRMHVQVKPIPYFVKERRPKIPKQVPIRPHPPKPKPRPQFQYIRSNLAKTPPPRRSSFRENLSLIRQSPQRLKTPTPQRPKTPTPQRPKTRTPYRPKPPPAFVPQIPQQETVYYTENDFHAKVAEAFERKEFIEKITEEIEKIVEKLQYLRQGTFGIDENRIKKQFDFQERNLIKKIESINLIGKKLLKDFKDLLKMKISLAKRSIAVSIPENLYVETRPDVQIPKPRNFLAVTDENLNEFYNEILAGWNSVKNLAFNDPRYFRDLKDFVKVSKKFLNMPEQFLEQLEVGESARQLRENLTDQIGVVESLSLARRVISNNIQKNEEMLTFYIQQREMDLDPNVAQNLDQKIAELRAEISSNQDEYRSIDEKFNAAKKKLMKYYNEVDSATRKMIRDQNRTLFTTTKIPRLNQSATRQDITLNALETTSLDESRRQMIQNLERDTAEGQQVLSPNSVYVEDQLEVLRKANEGIINISGLFCLRLSEEQAKVTIQNLLDHRRTLMIRINNLKNRIENHDADQSIEFEKFELREYNSERDTVEDRLLRVCNHILYRKGQSSVAYSEELKNRVKEIMAEVGKIVSKPSRIALPIRRTPKMAPRISEDHLSLSRSRALNTTPHNLSGNATLMASPQQPETAAPRVLPQPPVRRRPVRQPAIKHVLTVAKGQNRLGIINEDDDKLPTYNIFEGKTPPPRTRAPPKRK